MGYQFEPSKSWCFFVGNHLIWGYPPEIKQSWLKHRPWMGNGKIFSTWVIFRCYVLLPKAHWVFRAPSHSLQQALITTQPEKHMKIGMFTHATEAIRSEPAKSFDGGHRIELAQVLVGVPAWSVKVPQNRRVDHGWSSFAHSFLATLGYPRMLDKPIWM